MGSQILQAHAIWEITLHQVAGRLREQHLPSVTSAHDPCRMMHIQADIPLGGPPDNYPHLGRGGGSWGKEREHWKEKS